MRNEPRSSEHGVTLIELMIAVTLVAALMTGLLMVMRTALITYEHVDLRLEDNRRVVALQQTLERQIAGVMPVPMGCGGPITALAGDAGSLRFVSTDSLAEGSRGYPRMVEYHAEPDPDGGVRLMMTENLYTGFPSCGGANAMPGESSASKPMEMAGKLAACSLSYQDVTPDNPLGGAWLPVWINKPTLPRAVRIEMTPLNPSASGLPTLTLNVPLRITRMIGVPYVDE
jgi:prepilin-type N-terminal cleavage/methylation domain-containing protein